MPLRWFVLAPGPSMSAALAERVCGQKVCAVGNVFELAPWADLLVASDRGWWKRHPKAVGVAGIKYTAQQHAGLELVKPCTFGTSSNSGVLALDVLRNLGATQIVMLGFDMHGTHFFGPYTNGCMNTPERRRQEHLKQFEGWAKGNKALQVVNCTPGSKLKAFPAGDLDDYLLPSAGDGAGADSKEDAAAA